MSFDANFFQFRLWFSSFSEKRGYLSRVCTQEGSVPGVSLRVYSVRNKLKCTMKNTRSSRPWEPITFVSQHGGLFFTSYFEHPFAVCTVSMCV